MHFKKVNKNNKACFAMFRDSSLLDQYRGSELTFQNLFCWNVHDVIDCNVDAKRVVVAAKDSKGLYFLPPLAKDKQSFVAALAEMKELAVLENVPFRVRSCSQEFMQLMIANGYHEASFVFNRDYSEYLYAPQQLIDLSGKKLQQKRNHLNYFNQNYQSTFVAYQDKYKQQVLDLLARWAEQTSADAELESKAFARALDCYQLLELVGGLLFVDDLLVACSFGFINHNNTAIVMFEKADMHYRGAFNRINHDMVQHFFAQCEFVNRQEDMGIEGLRKAKLSYQPVGLFEKFDYCE